LSRSFGHSVYTKGGRLFVGGAAKSISAYRREFFVTAVSRKIGFPHVGTAVLHFWAPDGSSRCLRVFVNVPW
jgi:hypothetical protein